MRYTNIDAGVLCVPREWWREAPEAGGCGRHGLPRSHSCLIPGVRPVDAKGMWIVGRTTAYALSCAWRNKEHSWCLPLSVVHD